MDHKLMGRDFYRMDLLTEASKPLVEFVNKHCSPHDVIVVRQGHIDLYNGEMGIPVDVPD